MNDWLTGNPLVFFLTFQFSLLKQRRKQEQFSSVKVTDTNFLNKCKHAYEDLQCSFFLVGIKYIFFLKCGIDTTFLKQFILMGCFVGVEIFVCLL